MNHTRRTSKLIRATAALLVGGALLANIGCGLNLVGTGCSVTNVSVGGDLQRHRYEFDIHCTFQDGDGPVERIEGHVKAGYSASERTAQEVMSNARGRVEEKWTDCTADPWTEGGVCTNAGVRFNPDPFNNQVPEAFRYLRRPFSAEYITGPSLKATLDEYLNAQAIPLGHAKPRSSVETDTGATTGVTSRASQVQPSKPDLVAVRVSGQTTLGLGQTTVYEAVVRNDGDLALEGTAAVQLGLTGALDGLDLVSAPPGWSCAPAATAPKAFACTGSLGGAADPLASRVANVRVRARGAARASGTVYLSANPGRTVDESSLANNLQTLTVVVQ